VWVYVITKLHRYTYYDGIQILLSSFPWKQCPCLYIFFIFKRVIILRKNCLLLLQESWHSKKIVIVMLWRLSEKFCKNFVVILPLQQQNNILPSRLEKIVELISVEVSILYCTVFELEWTRNKRQINKNDVYYEEKHHSPVHFTICSGLATCSPAGVLNRSKIQRFEKKT